MAPGRGAVKRTRGGRATRTVILLLLFWLTAATPVLCQPGEPTRPRAAGTAREGDVPGYVSRALAADAPSWLRLGMIGYV